MTTDAPPLPQLGRSRPWLGAVAAVVYLLALLATCQNPPARGLVQAP